jgi:hypothetical protein
MNARVSSSRYSPVQIGVPGVNSESPRPRTSESHQECNVSFGAATVVTTRQEMAPLKIHTTRAWLSIPLFAGPSGQLTHAQRMTILQRAYAQVDKTQANITLWLVVTAEA